METRRKADRQSRKAETSCMEEGLMTPKQVLVPTVPLANVYFEETNRKCDSCCQHKE